MACLRKRKTKDGVVFDVDFTYKGHRQILSTKTSDIKVATQILHDIQGRIARGTFDLEQYHKKDMAVEAYFDEYFKYAEGYKMQSTLTNERNYAKQFVKEVGKRSLRGIDSRLLDQWSAKLRQRVRPATFDIHRRFLKAAFNVAKKWGLIDTNPFDSVGKPQAEQRRLFLMDEEVSRLFLAIEADIAKVKIPKHKRFLELFRLFVEFLLVTGLRREEALSIGLEDLDLERAVIHVYQAKVKQTRAVPLHPRAVEILRGLGSSLFQSLNKHHVSRKFAHYLKQLELQGFKLHSLRHTFATKLVSSGVDIFAVSRLLGHSDIRTTLVYAKSDLNVLHRAVMRINFTDNNGKILVRGAAEEEGTS